MTCALVKPVIMWFRHDLRLADNPALTEAFQTGAPVIPIFILEESDEPGHRPLGGASLWWLHHSLHSLATDLGKNGLSLILKKGNPLPILGALAQETGASQIFWNRRYEPQGISVDKHLKAQLTSQKIECKSFNSSLLYEPWTIKNKQDNPFQVFTPFWKHCLMQEAPARVLPIPPQLLSLSIVPAVTSMAISSEVLDGWNLLPKSPNWAAEFSQMWHPGEEGAHRQLDDFLKNPLLSYKEGRNRPDQTGTSLLSPYLRWGNISPRQIWHAVQPYLVSHSQASGAIECYLSELGWREFSYHLLYHFPDLPTKPLRSNFVAFPWNNNPEALRKWQKGLTGYPIVDAGMRQLWHTGWMHNRVRMIVASFLIKDLLLPWQQGEEWFWDTLVDADYASNSASWQWVAGCGADAAPYFRIFNPVLQGEKFDPNGEYVRRWVPELKNMDTRWIHQPWNSPQKTAVYPPPLVDHGEAKKKALEAYETIRKT